MEEFELIHRFLLHFPDRGGTHYTQFSSVAQSYPTLCDLMDCSTPGFPVHHQLLELTQTDVHWVGNAIQPSHHLPFPSPPTFNLSQHQGLFRRVSSLHQVAKVLYGVVVWSPTEKRTLAIQVSTSDRKPRRGNMRYLPPLEMRLSSIAPNPVEHSIGFCYFRMNLMIL